MQQHGPVCQDSAPVPALGVRSGAGDAAGSAGAVCSVSACL